MISWTLDKTTYNYWTTTNSGEIEWGYPQHGDEVIIDDKFKYVFRVPEKEHPWVIPNYDRYPGSMGITTDDSNRDYVIYTSAVGAEQFHQAIREHIENGTHGVATLMGTYTQVNGTESIDDVRITTEIYPTEEPTDEISAYLQEANNLMNGR